MNTIDPHETTKNRGTHITVGLANGGQSKSTKAYKLDLPQLPDNNLDEHILTRLTHRFLISIVNIWDAGCKAVLKNTTINIVQNGQHILTVRR